MFDGVHYTKFRIDRNPQSSAACGWRCYSVTEDMNDLENSSFSSREQLQAAEIKDEHSV